MGNGESSTLVLIIQIAIWLVILAGVWKMFTKADQPGWAAIIPIYNVWVLLKIAGKPGWWIILLFIPLVNIIFGILTLAGLAKNFGKGALYVLGLIFLPFVFYPLLGLGTPNIRDKTRKSMFFASGVHDQRHECPMDSGHKSQSLFLILPHQSVPFYEAIFPAINPSVSRAP